MYCKTCNVRFKPLLDWNHDKHDLYASKKAYRLVVKGKCADIVLPSDWTNIISCRRLMWHVVDICEKQGFLWHHLYDLYKGFTGCPDLMMAKPPRLIFIKFKVQGRELGNEEHLWMQTMERCHGVEAYVFYSNDLHKAMSVIREGPREDLRGRRVVEGSAYPVT